MFSILHVVVGSFLFFFIHDVPSRPSCLMLSSRPRRVVGSCPSLLHTSADPAVLVAGRKLETAGTCSLHAGGGESAGWGS